MNVKKCNKLDSKILFHSINKSENEVNILKSIAAYKCGTNYCISFIIVKSQYYHTE